VPVRPFARWTYLLLFALVGVLLPVRAGADTRFDAKRHFRQGMASVAAGHYEEGISELKLAYQIKAHPAVLFNIAKAYQDEGKVPEALDYYQQYLAYDPPDAEAVRDVVEKLQASVAPKEPVKAVEVEPTPTPTKNVPTPTSPSSAKVDENIRQRLEKMDELIARLDTAVQKSEAQQKALEVKGASAAAHPANGTTSAPASKLEGADATAENATELTGDKGEAYEEVVVTASRYAQSSISAPVSTTTITSEEIQLSGAVSLVELLRRVPGIDVMRLGVSSADVSIRGFNQRVSNKLLVLVDGRSVYEDFLGFTLFEEIPIELDEIDHIEIIRGPASALYGANAFVGLINIITRRPGSGPLAKAQGGVGSGAAAQGSYVASQRLGRFSYRASVGYTQSDKWSVDFSSDRSDYTPQVTNPNLSLQSARANGVLSVAIAKNVEASLSAGVNRLYTEIYPLGTLRNYTLDGLHLYNQGDLVAGPFKIRVFWNHLQANAGPQYWPLGTPLLSTEVVSNVLDADAQLDQVFHLGGEHRLNVGVGYRLKTAQWSYLNTNPVENHFNAFAQEEYRPIQMLSISGSLRVDRHPLLDNGQPGFAVSPRGAVVVTPIEGHAIHFSVGTAFREPTLVESYTRLESPVPGAPAVAALTVGNPQLKPESIFAIELGYRAEFSILQLDVALYRNQVKDLIVLSGLQPLDVNNDYDPVTHEYLVGRSSFQNDPPVYTALGGELGVKLAPVDRLSIRGAFAVERIDATGIDRANCGPCNEEPAVKLAVGGSYRSPLHVDLNLDASWVSSTTWIERDPDATGNIIFASYPLGDYAVINARAGYRFFDDHLDVALVGTNLAAAHQEHPFGNLVETRVMATLGAQL
jgi:iron complex outermembrane receptor protein